MEKIPKRMHFFFSHARLIVANSSRTRFYMMYGMVKGLSRKISKVYSIFCVLVVLMVNLFKFSNGSPQWNVRFTKKIIPKRLGFTRSSLISWTLLDYVLEVKIRFLGHLQRKGSSLFNILRSPYTSRWSPFPLEEHLVN